MTTSWPSPTCHAIRSRASAVIADRAISAPNDRPAASTSAYDRPARTRVSTRSFTTSRSPRPAAARASRGDSATSARSTATRPATVTRNGISVSRRVSVPSKSKAAKTGRLTPASHGQAAEHRDRQMPEHNHHVAQRGRHPYDVATSCEPPNDGVGDVVGGDREGSRLQSVGHLRVHEPGAHDHDAYSTRRE